LFSLTRRTRIWFERSRDLIELMIIRLVRRGVVGIISSSSSLKVSWRGRRRMEI
jgi:hypothetical protein